MRVECAMHGTRFFLDCDAAAAPWARLLMRAMMGLPAEDICDGYRVEVGFSLFTLAAEDGGYRILAPDYEDGPLLHTTTDLTVALWVLVEQSAMLRRCGETGETVRFDDEIVVADGALDAPCISLQRYDDLEAASGWCLEALAEGEDGEVAAVPAEGYTAMYAYELLLRRPETAQVLALPRGYLAIFEESRLACLISGEDEEIDLN